MRMTPSEALELAGRIKSESSDKVRVKTAKTNGEGRVHLMHERTSETLTSVAEWDEHPLRRANAPRSTRSKKASAKLEADQATLDDYAEHHTIYEPEE